jgi:quercetin dioxygenase-like cupin family protein
MIDPAPLEIGQHTTLFTVFHPDKFPHLGRFGCSVSLVEIAPGGLVPIHANAQDELYFVVEGEILLMAPDPMCLKPGDVWMLRNGIAHSVANTSESVARYVVALRPEWTPPR